MDGIITGTATLSQSGPGNNGIEGVHSILQSSKTEDSSSDAV